MVVILVTLCKIYCKWEGPVWVLTFGYWVAIMQRTRINGGSEKMTKSVSEKKGIKETRISRRMTEFKEQRRWMSIVSVTSVVEWILFYSHSFHSWSQISLWFLPFHLYARTSWIFFFLIWWRKEMGWWWFGSSHRWKMENNFGNFTCTEALNEVMWSSMERMSGRNIKEDHKMS